MPRLLVGEPQPAQCSSDTGEEEAWKRQEKQRIINQVQLLQNTDRCTLGQKEMRHANNVPCTAVHIISSDDEDFDAEQRIISGKLRGFAGFASPVKSFPNCLVTTRTSHHNLRQPKITLPKGNSIEISGVELGKRSSGHSGLSAVCTELGQEPTTTTATPSKKKKDEDMHSKEDLPIATLPKPTAPSAKLLVPFLDQVVEVNSNSTTNSQRQKRLQRRYIANHGTQQENMKRSTESSSEFPVSSPSNPIPEFTKFLQRSPLLKNTLPNDGFERQLAFVSARNPQMTLADKIRAWKCDPELSDVEDVNEFDDLFQRNEDNKRKSLSRSKRTKPDSKEADYDFLHFRNVILKNLKSDRSVSSQMEGRNKLSNSVGTTGYQLRRLKKDARPPKEIQQKKKKAQSSTTPGPATSSSSQSSHASTDYLATDEFYSLNKKNQKNQQKNDFMKLELHEQLLCPSSTSDDNVSCTGNGKSKTRLTEENKSSTTAKDFIPQKQSAPKLTSNLAESTENTGQLGTSTWNLEFASREENSDFRQNRLNPDIDKSTSRGGSISTEPKRLIEMHLDFLADKKQLNLREKKGEIFKTPSVPIKHAARLCAQSTLKDRPNGNFDNSVSSNMKTSAESGLTPISEEDSSKDSTDTPVQHRHEGLHQQQEFCSYLGLTGMSTANAMATAVAELARSNIARRSLRVRRQLHEQETKERQQLEALKVKQLREIKQREKNLNFDFQEFHESLNNINESTIESAANDACSSQKSVLSNVQGQAQSVPSVLKQKSEIKIICHLAADDNNTHIQKISKKSLRKLTDPIRNTLIRECMNEMSNDSGRLWNSGTSKESEEGPTPTPRQRDQPTVVEDAAKSNKKTNEMKTTDTKTPTKTRYDCSPARNDREHKSSQCKLNQTPSLLGTLKAPVDVAVNMEDLESTNTKEKLHMKFQEYLKASRLTKPSIYIVQSIDNDEKKNKIAPIGSIVAATVDSNACRPATPIAEPFNIAPIVVPSIADADSGKLNEASRTEKREQGQAEIIVVETKNRKLEQSILRGTIPCRTSLKRKSKHLGNLLTRSVLNMTAQRQLRNRKIVILKTIKRNPLPSKHVEKKLKKKYRNSPESNENLLSSNQIIKIPAKRVSSTERCRKKVAPIENTNLTDSPGEYAAESTAQNTIEIEFRAESHTELNQVMNSQANAPTESSVESAGAQLVVALYEQQAPETTAPRETVVKNVSSAVENELVVSSTTNCYDEQATKECSNAGTIETKHTFVADHKPLYTKDAATQSESLPTNDICQLTQPSSPLKNPLKSLHGKVLYVYYELDVLITVQETLLSFWKYSKIINLLNAQQQNKLYGISGQQQQPDQYQREVESTSSPTLGVLGEWLQLGECKRLQYDFEITSQYANRICVHNSIPIYVEMRCKELQKERRDCNLLSLYINVYFYNDEEMQAKMHSIQLDSVQSFPQSVIYTTITDSRYFVMSWPQENILGKMRSGLCKYSLTPQLDTLASIREFKSMRHEISYLECTEDDKLLGFGETQLTIWDHRSGDVLMNYDLGIKIGRNLGSVYYPSLEIGQCNMIVLFQYMLNPNANAGGSRSEPSENLEKHNKETVVSVADVASEDQPELHVIACNISHVAPSHRMLFCHTLPNRNFKELPTAINTGEHLLLTAANEEELWINCNDPKLITLVPPQSSRRFYARCRSQVIELTEESLTVNCVATHVLKIAATSP